ncbi:ShlB/FhaC/HecB family hemolysin secretion/activation protein, partial [Yersinia hibernica]|uniref:ShlB/FhaC/HecB family hemolysin secretion/activation protein n=2 Tax=Yersinia hibernica TaxID=2339259 RepID=UPI003CFC1C35
MCPVLRAYYYPLTSGLFIPLLIISSSSDSAELPSAQQSIHQQERQRVLEERLSPSVPDVRLSEPTASLGRLVFPIEKPCFAIDHVTLTGTEPLPRWLPLQRLANQAQGHCLGAKGINLLMSEMQNRLIGHGYVTTRVLAPQQDLNSGTLALHVVPGKIRHVALTPESDRHVTLFTAFPARAGHLLDLRDIEQGLENLQRIPTVQASMELIPGDAPGETDIALSWQQSKMWRLAASLDDSGTRSTGRYQGGATLFLDNPLSLSDQFYVSAGGSIKNRGDKGTNNLTGHYSLPFGYWTAGLTASSYDYHQTVAGLNSDYHYRGESDNVTLQLSRLLHRNASQKTTFTYDVLTRSSKNY